MSDYNVTDILVFKIAHKGVHLPDISEQVAAGCLVEGEPGYFYPIKEAAKDSWGDPVYVTEFDPTHRLVRGKVVPIV